jgi:beta-phosphoglucomutase family hydrolase
LTIRNWNASGDNNRQFQGYQLTPSISAVLWDLDGTLIDTAPLHWQAWNETLEKENFHLDYNVFLSCFGMRNDAIIPMWLGPQVIAADITRIAEAKETRFRELLDILPLSLLPGVIDWLVRLQQQGWRQAIATMAPRLNLEKMIQKAGIEQYLDAFATAEDVARGKPEPDIFLTAAARLGVPPSNCVVIEDAPAGIEAARRAGMRSIGVGQAVLSGSADLIISSLDLLPEDAFHHLLV